MQKYWGQGDEALKARSRSFGDKIREFWGQDETSEARSGYLGDKMRKF